MSPRFQAEDTGQRPREGETRSHSQIILQKPIRLLVESPLFATSLRWWIDLNAGLATTTSRVEILHKSQVKTRPCGNRSMRSGLSNVHRGPRWILSSSDGIKLPQRWSDHPVSGSVLYGRTHRPLRTWDSHLPRGLPAAAWKKL